MDGKDILLGVISIGSAIIAGYSIYELRKAKKQIDDGVDKIANAVGEVDISDTIIEEAVTRVVEKQAKAASEASVVQIRHDILEEVRKSVNEAYSDTQAEVKKELQKKIGEVSINDIRKKVVEEAAEKAQDKFDNDLSDLIKQYNKKIEEQIKIYEGVASVFENRKSSDGMTLKIGG